MGNVTLPTPVFVAGGALCLLAGYLAGTVTAPDSSSQPTAEVASFSEAGNRLCLTGDAVRDQEGTDSDGRLCGTWRRTRGASSPDEGQRFRFVSVRTTGTVDGERQSQTVIYGNVVGD